VFLIVGGVGQLQVLAPAYSQVRDGVVLLQSMCYTVAAMDELQTTNSEAVLVYLDGARRALHDARYNLGGALYGVAVNRAYYAFFYAATALLLTLDITRSKPAGVMAAFREHFVKPGIFPIQDSHAYGEVFELRNVTDYEMLGQADSVQSQAVVESASRFVERCETYLTVKGYV